LEERAIGRPSAVGRLQTECPDGRRLHRIRRRRRLNFELHLCKILQHYGYAKQRFSDVGVNEELHRAAGALALSIFAPDAFRHMEPHVD
jgi:hypothetical protein